MGLRDGDGLGSGSRLFLSMRFGYGFGDGSSDGNGRSWIPPRGDGLVDPQTNSRQNSSDWSMGIGDGTWD